MTSPLPATTDALPQGPFTRTDLIELGIDPKSLRGSDYHAIFRGVWVPSAAVDDDTRIRAAVHLHPPGAIASHFSAARLYDLPVPEHPFEHVTVFKSRDRRSRPGLKSHVTKRPRRIQTVRGIPVLDPVSTFIQLAGSLSLVDLVVLGDAIVKRFKIKPSRLVAQCRKSGDYYAARASEVALLVREGVDSPMETRLRLLIVLAGLPEPMTNVRIYNEDGTLRRRFDLYYPDGRLIVEYDGRQHANNSAQWHADLERREEFDAEGYRIIVVVGRDIYREPLATLERIRSALIARGVTDVPAISDGWREHFLGH